MPFYISASRCIQLYFFFFFQILFHYSVLCDNNETDFDFGDWIRIRRTESRADRTPAAWVGVNCQLPVNYLRQCCIVHDEDMKDKDRRGDVQGARWRHWTWDQ